MADLTNFLNNSLSSSLSPYSETTTSTLYSETSPLGSSQYTFYRYPKDLGSDEFNHYVVFFINVPTISSNNNSGTTDASLPQATINSNRNFNLSSGKATNALQQPIVRTNTAIALYMPPVVDGMSNNWDSKDLSVLGALAKDYKDNTGSVMDKLKSTMGDVTNSLISDLLKGIDNKFGVSGKDLASAVSRVAINPHSEVLYQGINFRRFSFDFQMTPRNEEEAVEIANIIRTFRFHAAPELRETKKLGRFWIYPSEFDIKFYSNGAENTFLNKISTCALTDVIINYAPGGKWQAYAEGDLMNGVPVAVEMSLSFTELELLNQDLIAQGL